MNRREVSLLVLVAFIVGLILALVIRFPLWYSEPEEERGSSSQVVDPNRAASRRWRVPVSFPTNLEVLGDNIIYVAGLVDSLSNGAFEFLIAEPKEIVPEFQIVDAVREGKIPAGYTWLGLRSRQDSSVTSSRRGSFRLGTVGVLVLVVRRRR